MCGGGGGGQPSSAPTPAPAPAAPAPATPIEDAPTGATGDGFTKGPQTTSGPTSTREDRSIAGGTTGGSGISM